MSKTTFLKPKESRIPFSLRFRVLMTVSWMLIIAVSAIVFSSPWFGQDNTDPNANLYNALDEMIAVDEADQLIPAHWK